MGGGFVLMQSADLWTRLIGGWFGNVPHSLALTIKEPPRLLCVPCHGWAPSGPTADLFLLCCRQARIDDFGLALA